VFLQLRKNPICFGERENAFEVLSFFAMCHLFPVIE
jgi:hypothetical protein